MGLANVVCWSRFNSGEDRGGRLVRCDAVMDAVPWREARCIYMVTRTETIRAQPFLAVLELVLDWMGFFTPGGQIGHSRGSMRAGDESCYPPEDVWPTQIVEDLHPEEQENFEANCQADIAKCAEEAAGEAHDGEDAAETATFLRAVEEYVVTPAAARKSQCPQSASSLRVCFAVAAEMLPLVSLPIADSLSECSESPALSAPPSMASSISSDDTL